MICSLRIKCVTNLQMWQVCQIWQILILLESTKLSQPDKIIGIRAINIVFIIDIVEPNGFKGLFTYYVSRRGGVGGMANADHC